MNQASIIKPIAGLIVRYRPDDTRDSDLARFNTMRMVDPLVGMIVGVDTDERVNLVVYDVYGRQVTRHGVLLVQIDAPAPADGAYCYFAPGQVGSESPADVDVRAWRQDIAICILSSCGGSFASDGVGAVVAKNIMAVQDALCPIGNSDGLATSVLYPAIRAAMAEFDYLPAGVNSDVDRVFNHLHRAFWSETPAPAGAAPLRREKPSAEPCD